MNHDRATPVAGVALSFVICHSSLVIGHWSFVIVSFVACHSCYLLACGTLVIDTRLFVSHYRVTNDQ